MIKWKQNGDRWELELAGGLVHCKVIACKPEPVWSVNSTAAYGTAPTIEEGKKLAIATAKSLLVQASAEIEGMESGEDRTPAESLRQALQEAKEGKRIPLDQMWDGIEEDSDNE